MVDPSDARSNDNSTDEEITSLEPLGIREPLLPAKPLGQTLLQPKFLSPLGARPLAGLDSSGSVLQAMPDDSLVDHFPQDNLFLTQSSAFPSEEAIAPRGEGGIAVGATAAPVIQPSRENSQSQIQFPLSSRGEPQNILNLKSETDTSSPDPEAISANTEAVNTVDTTVLSPTAGEMVAQMKESDVEQPSVSQQDTTTPLAGDELPPQNAGVASLSATQSDIPHQLTELTETTAAAVPLQRQAEQLGEISEAIANPGNGSTAPTATTTGESTTLQRSVETQPIVPETPEVAEAPASLSLSEITGASSESAANSTTPLESPSTTPIVQRQPDQLGEATLPKDSHPSETTVQRKPEAEPSTTVHEAIAHTSVVEPVSLPESTTPTQAPILQLLSAEPSSQPTFSQTPESANTQTQLSASSVISESAVEETEVSQASVTASVSEPAVVQRREESSITDQQAEAPPVVSQPAETTVTSQSENLISASSDPTTGQASSTTPAVPPAREAINHTSTDQTLALSREESSSYNSAPEGLSNEVTETQGSNFLPAEVSPSNGSGNTLSEVAQAAETSVQLKPEVGLPSPSSEAVTPEQPAAPLVELTQPEPQTADVLPQATVTSTNPVVQAFSESSSSEATETTSPQLSEPILSQGETSSEATLIQPSLESAPATIAESAAPPNLSAVAVETATPTEAQTAELLPEVTATSTPSIVQAFSEGSSSEAVVQPSLESAPATIAESAAPPNLSAVAVETATPTEAQTAELIPEATATSTPSIVQAFSESSASEATGTGSPQPSEPNFSEAAVPSEPTVTTSELTVAQPFSENPYSESTEADSLKSPALTEHVVTSASEGMISSAPTVVQPQLDSSPTTRTESAAPPIPSAVVGETATSMAESTITSEVIVPTPATTQHQELTVVQPRLETELQESTGEASPETTMLSSSPEESTGEMLHLAAEQTTPIPTPLIQAQLEEGGTPELPLADQVAETTIQRQLQQSDQAATASEAPTTTSGVEPVSPPDDIAPTQTDIIQPHSVEESSKPSTESSPEVGESLAFATLESEAIVQRQPSEETANAFDTAEAPLEVQEPSLVQTKQEFPQTLEAADTQIQPSADAESNLEIFQSVVEPKEQERDSLNESQVAEPAETSIQRQLESDLPLPISETVTTQSPAEPQGLSQQPDEAAVISDMSAAQSSPEITQAITTSELTVAQAFSEKPYSESRKAKSLESPALTDPAVTSASEEMISSAPTVIQPQLESAPMTSTESAAPPNPSAITGETATPGEAQTAEVLPEATVTSTPPVVQAFSESSSSESTGTVSPEPTISEGMSSLELTLVQPQLESAPASRTESSVAEETTAPEEAQTAEVLPEATATSTPPVVQAFSESSSSEATEAESPIAFEDLDSTQTLPPTQEATVHEESTVVQPQLESAATQSAVVGDSSSQTVESAVNSDAIAQPEKAASAPETQLTVQRKQEFPESPESAVQRPVVELAAPPLVQREDSAESASQQDKLKEGAKKVGEAFLETKVGKKLKEDAAKLGKDFVSSTEGKVITGAAAVGAITGIIAANAELPMQVPEIPLDVVAPGLKMQLTYEGPVQKPTKAMITFTFTTGGSSDQKPALTEADNYRAETARLAAEQEKFKKGLKYSPGSPEDLAAQAEEWAAQAWLRSQFKLPGEQAEDFLNDLRKKYPALFPNNDIPPSSLKLKPEEQQLMRKEAVEADAQVPESTHEQANASEPEITASASQVQLMPQREEALPEIATPQQSDRTAQPSSTPTPESLPQDSSPSEPEITTSASQVQLMPQSEETLPETATPQQSDRTEQPSSTPTLESSSEVSSPSEEEITASASQVQLMPQSGDTLPEAEVDSSSQSGGLIVEPSSSVQDIVQTKLEGEQVAAPTDVAASTGDPSLTSTVETLAIEATTTLSPPQDNNLETQIGTGSDVTVAQLFSEAKETPVLPTVLENLGQINPLGQSSSLGQPSVEATPTSPLLSRQSSSSLSGEISPMIQRMPDASVGDSSEITLNQSGISDRVSRQAELTPMNLSSLSSSATDSNVDIQQVAPISPIISRQESQDAMTQVAPSTDIPTSWSSIADLLGGSNTVDSEPPVIQRHPEHQQSIDSQSPVIQRHQDNGRSDSKAEDLVFTPEGFRRGDSPVASSTSKVRRSLIQTKKRQRSSAYPILEKELPSGADSTESSSNEVTISRQTPQEDDSYNLEILAQEIYSLVQQRLQIEQERHGRHYSGRLPW